MPRHVLGIAEKQIAVGQQREVEQRDQAVLKLRVEVDQQVAARDEVKPRERRVLDDVVLGEDAHLAQLLTTQ